MLRLLEFSGMDVGRVSRASRSPSQPVRQHNLVHIEIQILVDAYNIYSTSDCNQFRDTSYGFESQ